MDYVGLRKRFYSAEGEMMATSINYEGLPPVAPEFDAIRVFRVFRGLESVLHCGIRVHPWLNTLFAVQRVEFLDCPSRVPRERHSDPWVEHPIARSHCRPYSSDMSTLLIIVVLLVLFGGGGGYYYTRRR